jgi:hypothetical protein
MTLLGVELKNEIVHDESEVTFTDLPPGQVKIRLPPGIPKAAKAPRVRR